MADTNLGAMRSMDLEGVYYCSLDHYRFLSTVWLSSCFTVRDFHGSDIITFSKNTKDIPQEARIEKRRFMCIRKQTPTPQRPLNTIIKPQNPSTDQPLRVHALLTELRAHFVPQTH